MNRTCSAEEGRVVSRERKTRVQSLVEEANPAIRNSLRIRWFTLVELLVVIAILSLLMAILLPSLSNAKKKSQQIICMSNMKSLGSVSLMYTDEQNGYLTPYSYVLNSAGSWTEWSTLWIDGGYIKLPNDGKWLYCPSWTVPSMFDTDGNLLKVGYGINKNWSVPISPPSYPYPTWRKLASIRTPEVLDFFGDTILYNTASTAHLRQNYYYSPYASTPDTTKIHLRHAGASNFWFLDGHGDSLSRSMLQGTPRPYNLTTGTTQTYNNFYP